MPVAALVDSLPDEWSVPISILCDHEQCTLQQLLKQLCSAVSHDTQRLRATAELAITRTIFWWNKANEWMTVNTHTIHTQRKVFVLVKTSFCRTDLAFDDCHSVCKAIVCHNSLSLVRYSWALNTVHMLCTRLQKQHNSEASCVMRSRGMQGQIQQCGRCCNWSCVALSKCCVNNQWQHSHPLRHLLHCWASRQNNLQKHTDLSCFQLNAR